METEKRVQLSDYYSDANLITETEYLRLWYLLRAADTLCINAMDEADKVEDQERIEGIRNVLVPVYDIIDNKMDSMRELLRDIEELKKSI